MCRYCVEYGGGSKWYLNPDNYRDELYTAEIHENTVRMLGGARKNTFEVGAMANVDFMAPDLYYSNSLSMALEQVTAHGGQIVPLEDALKIIDFAKNLFCWRTVPAAGTLAERMSFGACISGQQLKLP